MKILIKNGTIINFDSTQKANVLIENGKIAQICKTEPNADKIIDAKGKLIFPGLIDIHVHFRDPGLTYKEDIITGSKAAVAGGVTTCCAMANTKPINDSTMITKYMIDKANSLGLIDLLPVGAVSSDFKGEQITNMGNLKQAGCAYFSDDGLPVVSSDVMRAALEYSAFHGSFISSHSQDCSLSPCGHMNEGKVSMKLGINGMPREQEEIMISRDMLLAKLTGGHIHIAHISSAYSLKLVQMAKNQGINITCEVTPHHFTLSEDDIGQYDTNYKMSPPLRTKDDVKAMQEGLKSGLIDMIATDHAPHSNDDKFTEFDKAPFGIIGLQTLVPLTLDLVNKKIITLNDMARLCSKNPANLLNLTDKGEIKVGFKADIAIIDPNLEYIYDAKLNKSKSQNSPFFGKKLKGLNVLTIKNGKIVYQYN